MKSTNKYKYNIYVYNCIYIICTHYVYTCICIYIYAYMYITYVIICIIIMINPFAKSNIGFPIELGLSKCQTGTAQETSWLYPIISFLADSSVMPPQTHRQPDMPISSTSTPSFSPRRAARSQRSHTFSHTQSFVAGPNPTKLTFDGDSDNKIQKMQNALGRPPLSRLWQCPTNCR